MEQIGTRLLNLYVSTILCNFAVQLQIYIKIFTNFNFIFQKVATFAVIY